MAMAPTIPMRMKPKKSLQIHCHLTFATTFDKITQLATKDDNKKTKVVFVLGTTAVGKSKLSIDLATHFQGEIINSDKIQVYKGLDILTNKIPEDERRGVPHHLLGFVEPDREFTTQDFCNHVHTAMNQVMENGNNPIIVGGSNRYMEALVDEDSMFDFKANYDPCFLWVDVALPILLDCTSRRVDEMVEAGLVDEVRDIFARGIDRTWGIWKAIGIPELEAYIQAERKMADEKTKKMLLDTAIYEIKKNTNKLINSQLMKIKRLRNEKGWKLHHIDATRVYEKSGKIAKDVWDKEVLRPSLEILANFFRKKMRKHELWRLALNIKTMPMAPTIPTRMRPKKNLQIHCHLTVVNTKDGLNRPISFHLKAIQFE
ncbi:unnamed protein product [Dovyalis caffra]|uniref:adenylate dimethylallyltransferase (ADP/ATP-dependent) n=1 Tax=Dovyalis caffra TaxID=77055 RepID=A0AAV1SHK5_9ROSI|nr:unnamed protein product [Dovyalis caffra]